MKLPLIQSLALIVLISSNAPAQNRASTPGEHGTVERTVYYDYLDEDGKLAGGTLRAEIPAERAEGVLPASVATLRLSGSAVSTDSSFVGGASPNTANRVDLVFVGDGYRAHQLGGYASRVDLLTERMFRTEPYETYASYFNVHRVDVVSNQSGVDNAPSQGVQKDTAMDMTYWWGGVARALWVNASKAQQFANNAPDWDFIAALANRAEHGGLSLTGSGVVTVAANHAFAHETLKHELGHQLGKLADEYFTSGATYSQGERSEPNVSILSANAMANSGTKWAPWLGANPASMDGPVSTFQGGYYHQFGVYRPSGNSLMRNLLHEFNAPSAESLVIEIYKLVNPIDESADPNFFYTQADTLWITTMQPDGHELEIQWTIDDVPIPGATGTSLDLCSVPTALGWHAVGVEVVDRTPFVRNEAARAQWMSSARFFVVNFEESTLPANYCEGGSNSAGQQAAMHFAGSPSLAANDMTFSVSGVPPAAQGVFFWGTESKSIPFGGGNMCVGGEMLRLPQRTAGSSGSASFVMDLDRLPPGEQVVAGDVRHVQFYYRDFGALGTLFNLSDGLRLTFCP